MRILYIHIRYRVGHTDRRTDRILIAKPRLHSMQRGKNLKIANPYADLALSFYLWCEFCKLHPCMIRISEAFPALF